jgi:3-methyladenine DNA glycosylase/8-oxoguanine DNA glycosylase
MPTRRFTVSGELDLRTTLGALQHSFPDDAMRLTKNEAVKATRTPDGPATVHLTLQPGELSARAWGPGGEWALENAGELAGLADDPNAFRPTHPILDRLHRSKPGMRIPASRSVVEALIPTIIGQKVTSEEAHRSYARLRRSMREPAPGPFDLSLPPDPERIATLPYYEFHRFGIERRRAETLKRVCAARAHLEQAARLGPHDARRHLQAFSGIGPWTTGSVTMVVLGDPDAVIVGDYHIPHIVAWVLAGEPRADDVRMLQLLRPYKGQRGRVIRLLKTSGFSEPAFGPKKRLRSIERI